MIKAFFSSVASPNENDYLTLRRLNYLFIPDYHLLSLSPHLWPLHFSQWLYKFLFHLKASEHLFSSWVELSDFFPPAYRRGTSMHPFPSYFLFINVCTIGPTQVTNSNMVFKFSTIIILWRKNDWLGRKLILISGDKYGMRSWISGRVYYYEKEHSRIPWFWSHASTSRRQLVDDVLTRYSIFIFCKEKMPSTADFEELVKFCWYAKDISILFTWFSSHF